MSPADCRTPRNPVAPLGFTVDMVPAAAGASLLLAWLMHLPRYDKIPAGFQPPHTTAFALPIPDTGVGQVSLGMGRTLWLSVLVLWARKNPLSCCDPVCPFLLCHNPLGEGRGCGWYTQKCSWLPKLCNLCHWTFLQAQPGNNQPCLEVHATVWARRPVNFPALLACRQVNCGPDCCREVLAWLRVV